MHQINYFAPNPTSTLFQTGLYLLLICEKKVLSFLISVIPSKNGEI